MADRDFSLRETFHVYVPCGLGTRYLVRYARDHDQARKQAEDDGYTVMKVRRAPSRPSTPWGHRR